MANETININRIPKMYQVELTVAGFNFSSDRNKDDLSTYDIATAYNSCRTTAIIWNLQELKRKKYALFNFFTYLYNTDKNKFIAIKNALKDDKDNNVLFRNDLEELYFELNNIIDQKRLFENNISFEINTEASAAAIKNAGLKFTVEDNKIRVTGRRTIGMPLFCRYEEFSKNINFVEEEMPKIGEAKLKKIKICDCEPKKNDNLKNKSKLGRMVKDVVLFAVYCNEKGEEEEKKIEVLDIVVVNR